jgi:hypothetical protein
MKKRLISLLLVFVISLFILPLTVFAAGTLSNFKKVHTYAAGQFGDVPGTEWFADEVRLAYEYGLVNGTTPTTFSPGQNLTVAEAIKFAACLNEIYNTGVLTLTNGKSLWYQPYVDYALSHGLISPYPYYEAYAARSDMAVIFSSALPDGALTPINTVEDNAIPDVSLSQPYAAAVYKLYRAGILTGVDGSHTYRPSGTITRAEVATIVARMADSGIRAAFTMSSGGTTGGSSSGNPQTTAFSLAASPSEISVAKGAQALVSCTVGSRDFNRIVPVIDDPTVVSCTWGMPAGTAFPLAIIGLSAGTTAITVNLLDADDTVLAETTISVTVTGDSAQTSTVYFSGYYPVPDYGIYVSTAPYDIDYDTANGSTFYAYRISDITADMTFAVSGYINLLRQNSFIFEYSFYDKAGNEIQVFSNSTYRLRVFFTEVNRNGVPSIAVKATPF